MNLEELFETEMENLSDLILEQNDDFVLGECGIVNGEGSCGYDPYWVCSVETPYW